MAEKLNLKAIAENVSSFPLVGMGESTHGTHEFFETKAEVFKNLVKKHGFNTLFFEAMDDHCETITQHLETDAGTLEDLVNNLFYVWRTQEILGLFKWLAENNNEFPVRIVGLDERKCVKDYVSSYDTEKYNTRDRRMADVVRKYYEADTSTKGMIWAHDSHVAASKFGSTPATSERVVPMGYHLREYFKDGYFNIAQLFGSGTFSSALIEESGESDNSVLMTHHAELPSEYFAEHHIAKKLDAPTFIDSSSLGDLIGADRSCWKRSLGWGVQRSVMHDGANVSYMNLTKAFNATIFFPKATASHLLAD